MVPTLTPFVIFLTCLVTCLVSGHTPPTGAFVTPGLPACYLSRSQYQDVSGLYTKCSVFNSGCRTDGLPALYMYCSSDHECCSDSGCPACCLKRSTLNGAEVTGIVIGCLVIVGVILGTAIYVGGRFFSQK